MSITRIVDHSHNQALHTNLRSFLIFFIFQLNHLDMWINHHSTIKIIKKSWIFVMSSPIFIVYIHITNNYYTCNGWVKSVFICMNAFFSFVWIFSRLIRSNHMTRIAFTKPFKYVVILKIAATHNIQMILKSVRVPKCVSLIIIRI